ncbi:MAG TPA: IPTL-CTERM sorting domain-containing protein [Thermoanaerobaculia bacterium]|nr:IPTL-CTERM sorting domain-containing protein [Thermoanaerobaculia bacterium]
MRSIVVLSLFATLTLFAQSTYTTGFEPPTFATGDVNGQNGWGHQSNSPTGGDIVTSPVHAGVQSLAFKTRNVLFDGVASHLYSARIDPAGETGSILTGTGGVVADPASYFSASLWYRTPDAPVTSLRGDGRVAELNPASKGPDPTDPVSRYAQVRTINSGDGRFIVQIGWYTTAGTFDFTRLDVATLQPGQWYRFDYLIHFVDGLDGNAPNDRFTLSVFDVNGVPLGTACGFTWEAAWKSQVSFGSGLKALAVNGFDFWSWGTPNGTIAGYIDDFTIHSFDAAALAVTVSGSTSVCFGGTTTLTANSSGATAYAWRDAQNNVVGTSSTFNAGPGTYTVTVTNSLCETATSSPFSVSSGPQLQASITGRGYVTYYADHDLLTAHFNGTPTGYVWRDAQNNIVGTGSTYNATAGTYTVTITDANCGNVTSPAFLVAAVATPTVPTLSELALVVLALGLAVIAILRRV